MKIQSLIAVSAFVTATVGGVGAQQVTNPCNPCPNGVTSTMEVEFDGTTMTCTDLLSTASYFESGSMECTIFEDMEIMCCPTMAANPCPFCPDGITFTGEIDVMGVSMTCSDFAPMSGGYEAGSDECTLMSESESLCCPPKAVNPCTLCPNGVITNGEIDVTGVVMTCSDFASVVMGYEADSYKCTSELEMLDVESCCSIPDETITTAPTDVADTATTTVVSIEETNTSTIATPSPEGTGATSGGIAASSPFGGFAFVAIASAALWTVLFV